MEMLLMQYHYQLKSKYEKLVTNKWFWCVFALILLVGLFAYAFYCTSKGYSFNGNIKLNWPKIWEIGTGCKR